MGFETCFERGAVVPEFCEQNRHAVCKTCLKYKQRCGHFRIAH